MLYYHWIFNILFYNIITSSNGTSYTIIFSLIKHTTLSSTTAIAHSDPKYFLLLPLIEVMLLAIGHACSINWLLFGSNEKNSLDLSDKVIKTWLLSIATPLMFLLCTNYCIIPWEILQKYNLFLPFMIKISLLGYSLLFVKRR